MASYTASSGLWSTCNSGSIPADGDVITVDGSSLTMDEDSATGEAFAIIIPANKIFQLNGWSFDGTVTLAGSGALFCGCNYISDDPGCDFAGTLTATSDGVEVWINTGTVDGEVDMDDHEVTWGNPTLDPESASVGSIICSKASSTLDLGTDGAGGPADASGMSIKINSTGTVTPSANISCGSFTLTAGTYGASAYNHTIHGDLIMRTGTLGSQTGTWTMAVDDGSLSVLYDREVNLVVADGVTPKVTGYTYLKSLTGSAFAAINIQNQQLHIGRNGNKANKWAFLGSITGTGIVTYWADVAGDAVTTPVDIATTFRVTGSDISTSYVSISSPTLLVESGSSGKKSTASVANLEATTVQIGASHHADFVGGLILTGSAKIGSLAKGAGNTGANTLHLAGSTHLTGTLDGTDLTITAAAGNKIVGGTLTEVNASLTETIRAYRAVGVDDVSNLNVDFRKRLGSGSGGGGLAGWHRVA